MSDTFANRISGRFTLPESLAGTVGLSLLVDGRRSNVVELAVSR
jgi:hypothetical protein